jgi:hypothetical protein
VDPAAAIAAVDADTAPVEFETVHCLPVVPPVPANVPRWSRELQVALKMLGIALIGLAGFGFVANLGHAVTAGAVGIFGLGCCLLAAVYRARDR